MRLRKLSHSDFIRLEVSYCYGTENDPTFDVLIIEKFTERKACCYLSKKDTVIKAKYKNNLSQNYDKAKTE